MSEGGATRMNVSVPRDLKAEMDAVGARVNLSAVASEAFRHKLLEIESQKESKTMDDVIARLKASEELDAKKDYQAGLAAGRDWAKSQASAKELRRLADYIEESEREANSVPWWHVDDDGWMAPFGATDYLVFAVWPEHKDDRAVVDQFWEEALGEDAHRIQDADFFHGFGDGAVEVWDAVRNKL